MLLGNRIKMFRKYRNITQKELSKKVGVSEQAISQYERGLREPNLEIINKIVAAINLPITYLWTNNPTSFTLNLLSTIGHALTFEGSDYDLINKLSNDLNIEFKESEKIFHDKSMDFPIEDQIILFAYLKNLDIDAFIEFCEDNASYINAIDELNTLYTFIIDDIFGHSVPHPKLIQKEAEYNNKEYINWTNEELESINQFKAFLLYKRNNKEGDTYGTTTKD